MIGAITTALFATPAPATFNVEYLVIAGGGGGGGGTAGGGGGGGYRTATGFSLNPSTAYTVTVGAGGAKGLLGTSNGSQGVNSVFSTITSDGGGGGSTNATIGGNGGSGGGGGAGANGVNNANGGAGVVILKYPDTYTISIGVGLTGTTGSPSGGFKVSTITAGTGTVSFA